MGRLRTWEGDPLHTSSSVAIEFLGVLTRLSVLLLDRLDTVFPDRFRPARDFRAQVLGERLGSRGGRLVTASYQQLRCFTGRQHGHDVAVEAVHDRLRRLRGCHDAVPAADLETLVAGLIECGNLGQLARALEGSDGDGAELARLDLGNRG